MLAVIVALLAAAPQDSGQTFSWPWWRGPDRNGISRETGWSSEGAEKPLWTAEVGLGHSSFAVVDGKLYTLGFDDEAGLDVIWGLDATTGEGQWTYTYPATRDAEGPGGGTAGEGRAIACGLFPGYQCLGSPSRLNPYQLPRGWGDQERQVVVAGAELAHTERPVLLSQEAVEANRLDHRSRLWRDARARGRDSPAEPRSHPRRSRRGGERCALRLRLDSAPGNCHAGRGAAALWRHLRGK